jgi:hypothetical protein
MMMLISRPWRLPVEDSRAEPKVGTKALTSFSLIHRALTSAALAIGASATPEFGLLATRGTVGAEPFCTTISTL